LSTGPKKKPSFLTNESVNVRTKAVKRKGTGTVKAGAILNTKFLRKGGAKKKTLLELGKQRKINFHLDPSTGVWVCKHFREKH